MAGLTLLARLRLAQRSILSDLTVSVSHLELESTDPLEQLLIHLVRLAGLAGFVGTHAGEDAERQRFDCWARWFNSANQLLRCR